MNALFGSMFPNRVLIDVGFFTIYWYGLIMALAIIVSLRVIQRIIKKAGTTQVDAYDMALWIVPGAIIGARLWHVFVFQWEYYAAHTAEIVRIWEGGIAIHGALVGGLLALLAYAQYKKVRPLTLTDCVSVVLPLGQAVGRWGNFFNQELYGRPTNAPWAIYIEPENRIAGYEAFDFFHPTFLYESILNLILFMVLFRFGRRVVGSGRVTALYVAGYGLIRFIVDFVRIDPMPAVFGLRYSQYISLVFIMVGLTLFIYTKTADHWRDGGDSNPRPPA